MNICPNFKSDTWKHLVSKLGELEAYKYFHQRNGDLSNVLTDEEQNDLIDQAKLIKDDITQDVYGMMFDKDPKQFLLDMADQLTSDADEASTAKKIIGPELSNIALRLMRAKTAETPNESLPPISGSKVIESKIDPARDNPNTKEEIAYTLDQKSKASRGNLVNKTPIKGGFSLSIDPTMVKVVYDLTAEQRELYTKFFFDNLYTTKDNPTTTELLNNAAAMAKDLHRPDLVNLARFIYKYLSLNPLMTVSMVNTEDDPTFKSNSAYKAYFTSYSNKTVFNRQKVGNASAEIEVQTVLEELLHGLTVQPWDKHEAGKDLTPNEQEFKDTIDSLYNDWKSRAGAIIKNPVEIPGDTQPNYRFTDAREFLVGTLMDNSFKQHLKTISDPKMPEGNFFIRAMRTIVKAILKLFRVGVDSKVVNNIETVNLERGLIDAMTDYFSKVDNVMLGAGLKEEGRNYGLSFAIIAGQDYQTESERVKNLFTPEMRSQVKSTVDKAILQIKSFGSAIGSRLPESNESFKGIFRQLKKLQEPEYNVDQIDFFFDFTTEIAALMNIAHEKMTKLYNDLNVTDPDFKIKEYEGIISAIRNFDAIQKDIESVKLALIRIGATSSVEEIDKMRNKREEMERMYSNGVFPLVTNKFVQILDPASQRALTVANANLEHLNNRLVLAKKGGNQARINTIQKKINEENKNIQNSFGLNADKVADWLRGEMGDSNILSTWLEAGLSNSNPIVGGVSKFIRDSRNEVSPRILKLQNDIQSAHDQYARATGRSQNDLSAFNSPLLSSYKIIERDAEGNPVEHEKIQLINPFTGGHIRELQQYKHDISQLSSRRRLLEDAASQNPEEIDDLNNKIKAKIDERRQFMRDYMELPYHDEVHAAMDLLYKNLGGYSAWDYMGPLISDIEDIQDQIENTSDEGVLANLYDQLDDKNFELKRLNSLYEKSPDSRERKVAETLKERQSLMSKYSDFVLTDRGKTHFEAEKARIEANYKKGKITDEKRQRWYQENTVTELAPSYWEEKNRVLAELADILGKMGSKGTKNEEITTLYKDMEDIVKAHRDLEGIVNGQEMTEKELRDVKRIEERIEDVKDKIANVMGLSRLEKRRLQSIATELSNLDEQMLYAITDEEERFFTEKKRELEDEQAEIESKKKRVDKKLLTRYLDLLSRLSKLDQTTNTKYYTDELAAQMDGLKSSIDVSNIPTKFKADEYVYRKEGPQWYRSGNKGTEKIDEATVINKYTQTEADKLIVKTKWWENNHITRWRWVKVEEWTPTDPEAQSGQWEEVEDPIYAWRQTRPVDSKFILNDQPSIKYKTRIIKPAYVNDLYKESVTGDINPKLVGAKDDRFINKDYFRMRDSKDPTTKATFDHLQFLTDTYLDAQESIPKGMRPGYVLPSIRKSTVERFLSKSLAEHGESLYEHAGQMLRLWNDDVVKNEQDKDILFGYNDDFSGIIPVKYLGSINPIDQSIDVSRLILMSAAANIEREQLIKALPFVNAVKDIVNNPDYRPIKTKNGVADTIKKKFLPKNTELSQRKQTSNTALQINELIKSEFYGENMKDVPGAKFMRTTLGIGAKLLLGFNFISATQNYANAFTQSMMETESKVNGNFTLKNYRDANRIYYANLTSLMSDIGKYGNKSFINQFFDYFGGINMKLLNTNHKTLTHGKVIDFVNSLGTPNQITEHMLNYQMGLAIALNYNVKGPKGMEPIFNAFTLKNRRLELKEGYTVTEADRVSLTSRLNSSARRINGEYGDRILVDKYILGRMALFMNRYVIPFVAKRYGKRKFDVQDGVREEGYWRLLGKLFIQDIKAKSIPIIGGWKYYSAEEKTAIQRAATEFGFSVMFFLAISALGGNDDKKLKDNGLLANNMIYALKGIQQQNETFMPIPGVGFDDIVRKIQNPFPIFGKIKNLVSLVNDAAHTVSYEMGLPGVDENDVYYTKDTGWHHAGDLKLYNDLERLLTLPYRLHQYSNPDVAVKNLDMFSRIR